MDNNSVYDIKDRLKNDFDLIYREVQNEKGTIYAIYISDISDAKFITEYVIAPLVKTEKSMENIDIVKNEIVVASSVGKIKTVDEAVVHILSGDVILIFSFLDEGIYCEAKNFSKRSIDIPITEGVIKGPRAGFTESIVDNISLIRKIIKNPNLKMESFHIGEKSDTIVVMAFIDNIAPEKLVEYIRAQLNGIDKDYLLDSNYIEEMLRSKHTVFDTIGYTEKPDIVCAKMSEGRVAIVVDGTPFAITAPYFFIENFQTADDYHVNKYLANISRIIRIASFMIAALLPGLYLAIITYHFGLIPSVFTFRLAVSRAGVPFPTVVELFIMLFFFQLLREAGIRLPEPIGSAMSIVGALLLGDAAVGAGLTSQITVIIVALSSISSFLNPKLFGGVLLWSIIIVLFASVLGLPGYYVGFIVFCSHICGLSSCGYPYTYPLGTLHAFKYKDIALREDMDEISGNVVTPPEKIQDSVNNSDNTDNM